MESIHCPTTRPRSALRAFAAVSALALALSAVPAARPEASARPRQDAPPAPQKTPAPEAAPARRAGEEAGGPWWMVQTALTPSGEFPSLRNRRWWKKALELKPGESLIVEAGGDAAERMFVRREALKPASAVASEAIVWIIDDDGDGSAITGGDLDSDCYVVDYDADGLVDRMVDYIDDNGDQKAEEVDVRVFADGILRYGWFARSFGAAAASWNLSGYDPGTRPDFPEAAVGDSRLFVNKFDPDTGTWVPWGECPYAFFDTDGDGAGEEAIRVSAGPVAADAPPALEGVRGTYALPWAKEMAGAGIVNILQSFDVDRSSGPGDPFHYDMSFSLGAKDPYRFEGQDDAVALRRPPQRAVALPWAAARDAVKAFPAKDVGFSWQEGPDDTAALGRPGRDDDFRWEGLPWIGERRFMEAVVGPSQKWNVRREWRGGPSADRELYYSGIDRRIHLFGATEGWVQVGHFSGLGALGEIRMFDTDGDGFFDRWEVYRSNSVRPVRTTQVHDAKARKIPFDGPEALADFYLGQVLPAAQAENEKLLAAMNGLRAFDVPEELAAAAASASGTESHRRYARDILREWTYQALRDWCGALADTTLLRDAGSAAGTEYLGDLRPPVKSRVRDYVSSADSRSAWDLSRLVDRLDVAYGDGDYDEAVKIIAEIGRLPIVK